jgi:hypothetical protein
LTAHYIIEPVTCKQNELVLWQQAFCYNLYRIVEKKVNAKEN